MHYRFHVNLFARPGRAVEGPLVTLRGVALSTLASGDGSPLTFDEYLPLAFEDAVARLQAIPRLDAEPDGFFVLAGRDDGDLWRVSGQLFDFGGLLHRVELNGGCPHPSFDALLACLGWPAAPLAVELVREGVALDEPGFRRWAAASS